MFPQKNEIKYTDKHIDLTKKNEEEKRETSRETSRETRRNRRVARYSTDRCSACKEGQPNQQAHYGGCMEDPYLRLSSDVSSSEDEEEGLTNSEADVFPVENIYNHVKKQRLDMSSMNNHMIMTEKKLRKIKKRV